MQAWHVAYDAIVEREGIALKPGLVELLDWLDETRHPQGGRDVDAPRRARRRSSTAPRSRDRFAALVGGDEIARGKPAPDIFVEAAARLGVAAAACVVLEDSEPGVRGALAAGMTPIMVPDRIAPSAALVALASAAVFARSSTACARICAGAAGA